MHRLPMDDWAHQSVLQHELIGRWQIDGTVLDEPHPVLELNTLLSNDEPSLGSNRNADQPRPRERKDRVCRDRLSSRPEQNDVA